MNVDEISGDVIPTDFSEHDRLALIFMRQHALSEKYVGIEEKNKLRWSTDMPVDLDEKFGQMQLKDFFWRVTEELTEAVQARVEHPDNPTHVVEELADALHFLVEAYLLAGMTPEDLVEGEDLPKSTDRLAFLCGIEASPTLGEGAYNVIHCIGCASNHLKQRPWKCTHQLVDRKRFRYWLRGAIQDLLPLFGLFGLTYEQVFAMYWRKSEVNQFRIRSNY